MLLICDLHLRASTVFILLRIHVRLSAAENQIQPNISAPIASTPPEADLQYYDLHFIQLMYLQDKKCQLFQYHYLQKLLLF